MNKSAKLGWLINRKTRRAEIYRQGQEVEVPESPTQLSGEDILPGFSNLAIAVIIAKSGSRETGFSRIRGLQTK
jgi:Uma2 family endonuclease